MATLDVQLDLGPEKQRRLRRDEFERMVEMGLFADERVELLRGVLVEMRPQDPRHASKVQRLTRHFVRIMAARVEVRIQLPLGLGDHSDPEPDLALVPPGDYDQAHPTTALLVIEVSGMSLYKDRTLKAALYAEAGIPEYWIVALAEGLIEVHTEPVGGAYTRKTPYRAGESIRLVSFPDITIAVADILG